MIRASELMIGSRDAATVIGEIDIAAALIAEEVAGWQTVRPTPHQVTRVRFSMIDAQKLVSELQAHLHMEAPDAAT